MVRAFPGLTAVLDRLPLPLALLRNHLLHRRCRELGGRYDVVVNTANEAWLGRPSIQYVHFPWGYRPRPDVELRWFHRIPGVLPLYYAGCASLSAFEGARMRENLMLVNSDWTGAKVKERYGGTTVTLYPPVDGSAGELPWEQREEAFLCIGRIAPEKRVERVVEIVARLRRTPQSCVCAWWAHAATSTAVTIAASGAWLPTRPAGSPSSRTPIARLSAR